MYNSDHSTEPDKITGWNQRDLSPKLKQFPLLFINPTVDLLSKSLTSFGHTHHYRVVYMGPRHTSNMKAYKNYCFHQNNPVCKDSVVYGREQLKRFNFTYSNEREKFFPIRVSEYRLFTGTNPTLKKDDLRFDSDFQCGNLDLAVYVNPVQYDLLMRVDSNTKGHTAWFYFKVSNITPKQKIKFNIINYGKKYLLYKDGMAPYVFKKSKGRWTQQGISITYGKKRFRYEGAETVLSECLSFIYDFKDSEEVYFSYCIPYSYSFLLHRLQEFKEKYSHLIKINYRYQSSGGLPIPLLTITNFASSAEKDVVLCVGRQHPGETQGSWMIDGFIENLLSANGHYLRQKNVFQIIPMLNVDGVILGNFRTGIMGRDLNRCFNINNKYNQIDLMRKTAEQKKPFLFLDFHGHSSKKNVFIYGPNYKLQHKYYLSCRLFPKLISKMTEIFRYHSCLFKISESKITTGRAIMLRDFNVKFSYTIEASTFGYGPHNSAQPFTAKGYVEMGQNICESLSNFVKFLKILPHRMTKKSKQKGAKGKDKNPKQKDDANDMKEIFEQVDAIDGLSVLEKQMLREILKDEQDFSDDQDKEEVSDSDCEGDENDYSASELNNIISGNQATKSVKKKPKKEGNISSIKEKSPKKQLSRSPTGKKSVSKRNFLEINKSPLPIKSKKNLKKVEEQQHTIKNSETIDIIERPKEKRVPSFKEKSQQILNKHGNFMESILKKRQESLKMAEFQRLPSISNLHDERNNNVEIGWGRFLNKSTSSSNHFIFDEPAATNSTKARSKIIQPLKSGDKKKNPIFSIRKSALPMVGRSCQTLDNASHQKSMLSEILEEHEKKKITKNLRIMYL